MGVKNSGQPTSSKPSVSCKRDIRIKCIETEVAIACDKKIIGGISSLFADGKTENICLRSQNN